jgi:alkanesulfonate monooxygenase SsuD/methylene tetrahydromethanopterin reductase-like flavin-dependent oxidoreductase (luciferase family)
MDLTQVKENNNIKFGCYIYQDGLTYKDIVHIALECERLGYDSIWLKDNYIPWIQDYLVSHLNNNANIRKLTKNKYTEHQKQIQLLQLQQLQEQNKSNVQCLNAGLYPSLVPLTRRIKLGAILVNLFRNLAIVEKWLLL